MKHYAVFAITLMAVLVGAVGFTGEGKNESGSSVKSRPDALAAAVIRGARQRTVSNPPSVDEAAIQTTAETYAAAFDKADARAAAAHYTIDAEYIDAEGTVYSGREKIYELLKDFFAAHPGSKLNLEIDSLRVMGSNVAMEDGLMTITFNGKPGPVIFDYTAVHVKNDGKWLTTSVRQHAHASSHSGRSHLRQLDWMLGEWVHEGDDAVVRFSCRTVDNGSFIVRDYTVHVSGEETMKGSQRIGWDPRSGKFRTWVFDSEGGFGEGDWHRDGANWVLKLVGVTGNGQSASSTSIYSIVDARTMTFQSVDHEVSGIELPDSPVVRIVRASPQPE